MSAYKIVPVLLGADLNCYNVARAFHEAYGVISHAFGRYTVGATMHSKIVRFQAVDRFDEEEVMLETLLTFAEGRAPDERLILLGCTDDYVSMIVRAADRLRGRFVIPYTTSEQMERLTSKADFYALCREYDLPFPETVVLHKGESLPDPLPFSYPIIIKPSSSVLYWKHPFPGMKKVYRAHDRAGAEQIISEIYASGYPDRLIIQDMIPGNDSRMYVLTSYSDAEGRVRMMCLGHVLLEEHTPKGLGNHAAIITEENQELCEKFRVFLEEVGFVGFSNFDIKYDERDGSFRVFEINLRQGRSNYYVTASGHNIARCVVEDRIEGLLYDGCKINNREIYWRYIPDDVVYQYIDGGLAQTVGLLLKSRQAYSSLRYRWDLRRNPKRRFFVFMHERNHRKKFRKYYRE